MDGEAARVKQRLKRLLFAILGKDSEAVVVSFVTGDPALCARMIEEVRSLVPERRHFTATRENWPQLRRELRRYRIGLAPVMLTREPNALRRAAYWRAPFKILAYNSRLERRHLRPDLSSFLFWRGVPLDRIYLRPWWWPWLKRERSVTPSGYRVLEGRACSSERRRIGVLVPYFPFPLSHGGAVRIFYLLRELAREFDVELFAFTDEQPIDPAPLLEFCARVTLVEKSRYREPRWSTLLPPEAHEFRSPAMRRALAEEKRAFGYEVLQVEYTQLAEYAGQVLVEHDITFDLFAQILKRERTLSAWWNWFRWRRLETAAWQRYARIVTMSKKDSAVAGDRAVVIENGVDLERFQPEPERAGQRLLFIGSFRHFPNVAAYRFFTEEVWPLLRNRFPEMRVTVVAGPDHLIYWRAFADTPEPAPDERIQLLGFVSDVRSLYVDCNLALVPTTVSAGTNVKALEAMAMQRAMVSTSSGCAGLGLVDGRSVWRADSPSDFAAGIAALITDHGRREQMARAAFEHAHQNFDWRAIGKRAVTVIQALLTAKPGRAPTSP
jgi:glycosyltransferase involved in cell wall biosynthesis